MRIIWENFFQKRKDLRSDKTIYSDWENKTIFYENMKKTQYKELKKYGEIVNY